MISFQGIIIGNSQPKNPACQSVDPNPVPRSKYYTVCWSSKVEEPIDSFGSAFSYYLGKAIYI